MSSLGANIVRRIIKAATYSYRKRHASISRSVKMKNTPYRAKKGFEYEVIKVGGADVEVLSPKNLDSNIAIVQFHGGGHTQSMNNLYRKIAHKLCKISGCKVYSIDYKTGADLTYPSLHDECFDAYVKLLDSLGDVIAVGDSFGANLLLSTCLRLRDKNIRLPKAIICISCYIDLAASGDSYRKNCYADPSYCLPRNQSFDDCENQLRKITPYCGDTSPCDKYLSPAYAEFDGFPPTLIQCGDLELSECDNDILYQKMKEGGVDVKLSKYQGMWHDFQYFTPFLK